MPEPEAYLFVPKGHDFSLPAAAELLRASQRANARCVELLPPETLRVEGDDWALRMNWLPPAACERLALAAHTRLQILLYTILLTVVTLLPFLTRMSGPVYLGAALILDAGFLYHALALQFRSRPQLPMRVFRFSVTYLARDEAEEDALMRETVERLGRLQLQF